MAGLSRSQENLLTRFSSALVNQELARIIVAPQQSAPGFWFGGGNLVEAGDGTLYLTGRYRNQGDSRAGLAEGTRGLELALFTSADRGASFQKKLSFGKADLSFEDRQVLPDAGRRQTEPAGEFLYRPPVFEMQVIEDLLSGRLHGDCGRSRTAPPPSVSARRSI